MTSIPLLSKSTPEEPFYVYLPVIEHFLSGVLVKKESSMQFPIYNVNESLINAETRYSSLENLVLVLTITSIKFRPYFEAHNIHVRKNYMLKMILHHPELTGRMVKWFVRLSMYDIIYKPRTTIKSQALVDFVDDFSPSQLTQIE